MRPPRVKFTIRWLIIAVFFIAITFDGTRWIMDMRKLAAKYDLVSSRYGISEYLYSDPKFGPPSDVDRAKLVNHISRLRQKYAYAARHPWLPVEPDRPEPIEATKWGIRISEDPTDQEDAALSDDLPHISHPPRS
jgi:hypothetical protein